MKNPDISGDDIAFPVGVTQAEIHASEQELYTFALETLGHLIRAETMANGRAPSLSLFCRMDIGVHVQAGGKLSYFVNEIARGPLGASLWTGEATDIMDIAPNLGAEFGPVLHRWMSSALEICH
jgi:hypothetical protein